MTDHLPAAVLEGLKEARRASLHRNDRLCVHDGDEVFRIRRFWSSGLSVDRRHGEKLRGRVEIFDGARHLYQCLIENARTEGEEIVFDFKWLHPVADQPAADFVRPSEAPAILISPKV